MADVIIRTKLEGMDAVVRDVGKARKAIDDAGKAANDTGFRRFGLSLKTAREEADKTTKTLTRTSASIDKFGDKAMRMGRNMSLFVTAPIVAAGVALFNFGSEAVESENLFEVAMGDMARDARAFSETLRRELGLNAFEARKQVATFFQVSTAMGVARGAALEMSSGLTQLTNDMASFFNLRPEDAFLKLQAGITGEIEPLRRLGVVVNELTIAQTAMRHGLIRQGEEMSEAQKVIARYITIVDQTKNAQGDLARTLDSPANKMRRLRAQFAQGAIDLGQKLLPAGSAFLETVGIPMVAMLQSLAEWFGELTPATQGWTLALVGVVAVAGPLLGILGGIAKVVAVLLGARGLAGLIKVIASGAAIAALGAFAGSMLTAAAAMGVFAASMMFAQEVKRRWDEGLPLTEGLMESFTERIGAMAAETKAFLSSMFSGEGAPSFGFDISGNIAQMQESVAAKQIELTEKLKEAFKSAGVESTKTGKAIADAARAERDILRGNAALRRELGEISHNEQVAILRSQLDSLEAIKKKELEAVKDNEEDRLKIINKFASEELKIRKEIADALDDLAADEIEAIEDRTEFDLRQRQRELQAAQRMFDAMGKEAGKARQRIQEEMDEVREQLEERTFGAGARRAMRSYFEEMQDASKRAERVLTNAFRSAEDALARFFRTGKIGFGDFLDTIANELSRFAAKNVIASIFGGGAAVGGGTAAAATTAAAGGFIKTGGASVAGSAGTPSAASFLPSVPGVGNFLQGLQVKAATGVGNLLLSAGASPNFASGVVGNLSSPGAPIAGFLGGIVGDQLFGGKGGLGGSLGATAGFAVGGPIGAAIGGLAGGFLGGLFGGKPSRKPSHAAVKQRNGNFYVESRGGPGGTEVDDTANKLASALNAMIAQGVKFNFNGGFGLIEETNSKKTGEHPFFWTFAPGSIRKGPLAGLNPQNKLAFGSEQALLGAILQAVQTWGIKPPTTARSTTSGQPKSGERAIASTLTGLQTIRGFQTGGEALFTRPSLITVAETGPERVNVSPLASSRRGGGVNIIFDGPVATDALGFSSLVKEIERAMMTHRMRYA